MELKKLRSIKREEIPKLVKSLRPDEIDFLLRSLADKEDLIRYHAFLILQAKSKKSPILYKYWDELAKKLDNPNSYQRNIGLRLLSENVRWDKEDKFGKTLDRYLSHCVDEKFVTARQAIQGLVTVAQSTHSYDRKIRLRLSALSFDKYNTGQQNLLRKDVFDVQEVLSDSSGNTE